MNNDYSGKCASKFIHTNIEATTYDTTSGVDGYKFANIKLTSTYNLKNIPYAIPSFNLIQ